MASLLKLEANLSSNSDAIASTSEDYQKIKQSKNTDQATAPQGRDKEHWQLH